ncbi:MAG: hypothetical protein C0608_00295 [Deltaproteobacteria bacterium]|nr:MAG: hypothetical protein C0608_00295 [Deltaproteobacteria bacterium]
MQVLNDTDLRRGLFSRSVVTMGNFDGVHLGHKALLRHISERAKKLGGPSVVYTFDPHPLRVLNPSFCPKMLLDFEGKVHLIAEEGIDYLIRVRFDRQYAEMEPEKFADNIIGGELGASEVWIGPDFAFGRGRSGNTKLLAEVGKLKGYTVHSLEPFILDGERVSSTAVRAAVERCDFRRAGELLGRPYEISGPVVHGRAVGKGLGFPTANILPRQECLPPNGVYSAWAHIGNCRYMAAVNIGPNPTFDGVSLSVEAFLLDFDADIYGDELKLAFNSPVRGEVAFSSPEALVKQIARDVERVRGDLSSSAEM